MFKDIKKYVINLKRRPDRLESVMKEFAYMGMEVEIFEGIDTNSHIGCTLSHQEIVKTAKENNWEYVIAFEDDIMFMPYAKSFAFDIEKAVENLSFGVLNLNPSFCCSVNLSEHSKLLVDLTSLPPKKETDRGIYGAGFMVYHKSVYDEILKCTNCHPLDEFMDLFIYPKYQSYAPSIVLGCSTNGSSDASGSSLWYNTYYTQTYNWNQYCPIKIPPEYFDQEYAVNLRKQGEINYLDLKIQW